MAIYAIGDLHLSLARHKSMDKFGSHWKNHTQKIVDAWIAGDNDYVLIAGDISWGINPCEAALDLEFIERLPGKKIAVKGNHDSWWGSTAKLNRTYDSIFFIKNNFISIDDYAICGTKGSRCYGDSMFQPEDERLYRREVLRLQASIDKATQAGFNKYIILLHYPPTNDKHEHSDYIDIINRYSAEHVIYGHLHGTESFDASLKGQHGKTVYHLVSSDYLEFKTSLITKFM